MTQGNEVTRDASVQSVDRAISILQVLARHEALGVTGIAEALALHKSTVSRLLATLAARGLVEQLPARGSYQIGPGILLLAQGVNRGADLCHVSRPVLLELAHDLGETVNINVREGDRVITVEQVTGPAALTAVNWVGRSDPLHATSPGRLFLAELDEVDLARILRDGLETFTEHTITDEVQLRASLARVRELGYAATVEELEIGLVAVAVPIRSFDGSVVAAVSASGPASRLGPDAIAGVAHRLKRAALQISERLGHPKAS